MSLSAIGGVGSSLNSSDYGDLSGSSSSPESPSIVGTSSSTNSPAVESLQDDQRLNGGAPTAAKTAVEDENAPQGPAPSASSGAAGAAYLVPDIASIDRVTGAANRALNCLASQVVSKFFGNLTAENQAKLAESLAYNAAVIVYACATVSLVGAVASLALLKPFVATSYLVQAVVLHTFADKALRDRKSVDEDYFQQRTLAPVDFEENWGAPWLVMGGIPLFKRLLPWTVAPPAAEPGVVARAATWIGGFFRRSNPVA